VREPEEVDATVRRIEELIETLGKADPQLRGVAEETIRLLMQVYGAAFSRIIDTIGSGAAAELADDKLVSSLLLLHGLHPVPVEKRIQDALRRVERRLDGAHLVLAEIADDAVRVRVEWNGSSAPRGGLAAAIEHAVSESAPEIEAVEVQGLPETLVQIT